MIRVPVSFPDGSIESFPLSEIDFIDEIDGRQSCDRYTVQHWKNRPLLAWRNGEGEALPVTLAAKYSGHCFSSSHGIHPIEHVTPDMLWGVPLVAEDGRPSVDRNDKTARTALKIPCADYPPFRTEFFCFDSKDETIPFHNDPKHSGPFFYRHPLYDTPQFWFGPKPPLLPIHIKLFVSGPEMLATPPAPNPLIGNTIQRNQTGQLFGPSGSAKTFVGLGMALSVATGSEWNGHQCEKGVVLYLTGEGHVGVNRRVTAWHKHNEHPDLSLFFRSSGTIDFEGNGLIEAIKAGREIETLYGEKIALIVVDTLARHLVGDENSTKDMSAFIRAVDGLRSAFPGSTALIVHHTGWESEKSGRARGSSALKAAMDFEISCDKGLLTFTKLKDGEPPPVTEFKLVPVAIGTDDNGEPMTSCVVEYGERSASNKNASFTDNERQAIAALIEASVRKTIQEGEAYGALIGNWREMFDDSRKQIDPDVPKSTLKSAFNRARDGLFNKTAITIQGNFISLTAPEHQETIKRRVQGANGVH